MSSSARTGAGLRTRVDAALPANASGVGLLFAVLGGRNGITLPGWLLVAPAALGVLLVAAAHDGDPFGPVLASGIAAQLLIGAVLLLVRRGLDRAAVDGLVRAFLTIATFAACGLIRTTAYLFADGGVAPLPPAAVNAALGAGVVVGVVGLTLGAIVVDLGDRFVGRSRQLRREQDRLDGLRAGAARDLLAVNRLVEDVVASPLRQTLAETEAALSSSAAHLSPSGHGQSRRLGGLALDLRHAADAVVRPLSHDLAVHSSPKVVERVSAPLPRFRRVSSFAIATVSVGPFQPAATLLVATPLFALAPLPHLAAPAVMTGTILGTAAGLGVVLGARRWLGPRLSGLRPAIRVPAVVLAWLVQPAAWIVVAWPFLHDLPSWPNLLAAILALPLLSLLAAGAAAFADGRRQLEAQVDSTIALATAETAMLRREAAQKRMALAHLLHGPVLGSVTAAAMLVATAASSGEAAAVEGARDATAHAAAAIASLGSPPAVGPDLQTLFAEQRRLWAGLVTLDVDLSPGVVELAQEPAVLDAIERLLGECLSNAVRHGRATGVTIHLAEGGSLGARSLALVVDDNGTRLEPPGPPGLGSRLLDDLTVSWAREPLPNGGTRVRCEIAPGRPSGPAFAAVV